MTPQQRAAALRLIDPKLDMNAAQWIKEAYQLLRELLAEPNPAPGYCKHCKQYTIEEPLPAEPQGEPVAWRDHAEQRLLAWKQRRVNRSGDQLALDDFMDKESLDDLIDFVCDAWAGPVDCGEAGHAEGRCGNASCCHGADAAPQQRKPLTEDFINDLGFQCGLQREDARNPGVEEFARAIERAHGIGEQE